MKDTLAIGPCLRNESYHFHFGRVLIVQVGIRACLQVRHQLHRIYESSPANKNQHPEAIRNDTQRAIIVRVETHVLQQAEQTLGTPRWGTGCVKACSIKEVQYQRT